MSGLASQPGARAERGWWDGGFGAWLVGRSCSNLGSAVTTAVVPLVAVVTLHAGPATVGLLVAAAMAAAPCGRLLAAPHAERNPGRVGPMVACDLGRLVAVGALSVAFAAGALSLPLLISAVGVLGALQGAFGAYGAPYVAQLVPAERLVDANGALASSSSAAAVAGPAVAAGIVDLAPAPAGLLAEVATYLIAIPALLRLGRRRASRPCGQTDPPDADPGPSPASSSGHRAALAAFRHPKTAPLLAATFAATLLNGVVLAELTLFMVRDLRIAPPVVALVGAAGALGGVAAGLGAARIKRRLGDRRAIAVAAIAVALSVAFFPLARPGLIGLWPNLVYELAGSAGGTICVVVTFTAVLTHLPPTQLARAMATAALVPEAGQLLGAAIATLAVTAVSVPDLLDVLAGAGAVLALVSLAVISRPLSAPVDPT